MLVLTHIITIHLLAIVEYDMPDSPYCFEQYFVDLQRY